MDTEIKLKCYEKTKEVAVTENYSVIHRTDGHILLTINAGENNKALFYCTHYFCDNTESFYWVRVKRIFKLQKKRFREAKKN